MLRAWPISAKITGLLAVILLFLSLFLAYLVIDIAITNSYTADSFRHVSKQRQGLEEFVEGRDPQASDLENFRALGLVQERQFDGKYLPWLNTELGLIRFNEDGSVLAICETPASQADLGDCPDTL